MEQRLKQRLVGAAVLLGAGVILLPVLLDDSPDDVPLERNAGIPERPASEFNSRITPIEGQDLEPAAVEQVFDEIRESAQEPEPVPEPVVTGQTTDTEAASPDEVPAEAPDSAASPPVVRAGITAWVVQLGSFSSQENATALEQKLRSRDYPAFVETLYIEDGKQYRVRVGPEVRQEEAKSLATRLAEEFKLDTIVVRYP